jgi:hypothetical protein
LSDEDDFDARIAAELGKRAGGYLRNVIRESQVTCDTCGTPVNPGWSACQACGLHRRIPGVADLVVPLVYSIMAQQSYEVFRSYKDSLSAETREDHVWVIARLFYLGVKRHRPGIAKRVGRRTSTDT